MSKILVTGGLGTVGAMLTKELRGRSHHVISCDIRHSHDEFGFSIRDRLHQQLYARCDVGEFRQLERIFNQLGPFDYVFHCAAEFGRWNGEDFYENLWKTNVVGTKNVLRLQEKEKFKLIHFSSSEVYGDWPDIMVESVMDEYELKQFNDYGMTKWVNENQIRNSGKQFNTESVVVRLFNTYGPGEYYSPYRSVNSRFLYCAVNEVPWTVFRGHARTSMFLLDAVGTLANITENFISGETYNIAGDEFHSIEELSDIVLKVTGAIPALANFQDSELLTSMTKKADISKSIADLGHVNRYKLEEGMRITAEWMRKTYLPLKEK